MCTRKVSRVHQELSAIIQNVAEAKKITDIEYNVIFGFEDVDSFASGFYKVQIRGKLNGCKVNQRLVIKWHHSVTDRACFREAYKREHIFCNIVTPFYLNIQRTLICNEGLKYKFPNCILSSVEYNKEVIVFHNIEGYKLFDRFQTIDFEHVSLVIKNLAKLHAFSFITSELHPDKFEEFKQQLNKDVQYSEIRNIPKSLIYYFNASLSVISNEKYKDKLRNISRHIAFILNKYSAPATKYNVICHADCWHNNIFFKYQGNRPVDAIFVDYQLVRFASPVTDISYFIYMCTDFHFLSKYYDQLLNIYHGTCSAVLRECNIDIEDVYPRAVFDEQLKEHSQFGLVEALISMKIITAESEEAQKMTEIKRQVTNDAQIEEYEIQNQDIFVNRVNGIVNFFFERNYSLNDTQYP
ncbi:unnamed protein product [Pieris macdunnoughi]|uniref:CHK kinase-like domain-containing protein n=1 Tax=Pieris macdunnoughi TaxID=345717 RepID=A0A821VCK3_9NEOP|nr:unnamed protein product [Pieris macdunnoughi]